ncbi:bifunctional shikimate kinase/3-dehydroquinate synthase [uncultured Bifidobacterium sp.]|uniref:bifunctional shikimate kinase/3-dehydroquinate synthase n=1 Tax=uncultured Bifidobacterium sp. TaxID=165187 RepID=UPI0026380AA5|nr:bifunctional shikimate kinase/3-dehydroquinate synthase [uncultured Bifidobacterium sp.]
MARRSADTHEKKPGIPRAVIIGMPGAGKTRIGKEAASLIGVPFKDSDRLIEHDAGRSISEIFEAEGEDSFRRRESRIICGLLDDFAGGILSLGGGAPMTAAVYEALREYRGQGGKVVYLDVDPDEAKSRSLHVKNRPLLRGQTHDRWMELYQERCPVYQSASNVDLKAKGTTPEVMAQRLADALTERVVHVSNLDPYDVRIGSGVTNRLQVLLGDEVMRVALIHTTPVQRHSDRARALLRQAGYRVVDVVIPDAEAGKTIAVAQGVWDRLSEEGFTRSDAVVGLGGGAATDLAGFIAATWMRGIRYVNCPTSLLAMVDASTGGKTGINLSQGKNLVGSFFTPVGVLADLRTLSTLPNEIFVEGLGEVAKSGFIMDPEILRLLEDEAESLRSFDGTESEQWLEDVVEDLIERTVQVKANHVSVDLKDLGLREFLNYGHTLGHAIEKIEHFTWRHGQAVSVGMVFAAELASITGHIDRELVDYHRSLLSSLGLRTTWDGRDFDQVLALMHKDKKARGNKLRFIILDGIGKPTHLDDPPLDAVREAFRRIGSKG